MKRLIAYKCGFSTTDPSSMWKVKIHSNILLPEAVVYPILKHLHEGTHFGRDAWTTSGHIWRALIYKGPIKILPKPVKYAPTTILRQNMPQKERSTI